MTTTTLARTLSMDFTDACVDANLSPDATLADLIQHHTANAVLVALLDAAAVDRTILADKFAHDFSAGTITTTDKLRCWVAQHLAQTPLHRGLICGTCSAHPKVGR